jgi:hypothetical protein
MRLRPAGFMLVFVLGILLAPSAAEAPPGVPMKLTVYDDGRSCPADCDAHVVFHPSSNGTANAHQPASASGPFQRCAAGLECRICFDPDARHCMVVMYRGVGPHKNTFDFTPAFYEEFCDRADLPRELIVQCSLVRTQGKRLDGRISCIRDSAHAKCATLMASAMQLKEADAPLYTACRQKGEGVFNSGRSLSEQRSNGCAYEKMATGGPNKNGRTWKKLLPAACRAGTFVGRNGLDCCSGSRLHDGPLGIECENFYPRP